MASTSLALLLSLGVCPTAFDPLLRVTNEAGELLAEDDDSEGGTTAYLRLVVGCNGMSRITVAAPRARVEGTLVLHLSEGPETSLTRAAADRALQAHAELKRLIQAQAFSEFA